MLLKELWGADCQIYSSKPTDPFGSQNWLLLWKWNISTGQGTSRTKIWTSGNQWVIVQMLYFLYFLSCRILVRCTIHVYKLYFPIWSMKSWTHPVFYLLMKGLLQWREHILNLSEEISISAKAPWRKISFGMCCTDCKISNQSHVLVCYKRKGHWSPLCGSGDDETGPIQADVDG